MDHTQTKKPAESRAVQLPQGYCSCPKCVGNSVFINDLPEPAGMGRILVCVKCQHVWRPTPQQSEQILERFSKRDEETNFYIKRYRPAQEADEDILPGELTVYTTGAVIGLIMLLLLLIYFFL